MPRALEGFSLGTTRATHKVVGQRKHGPRALGKIETTPLEPPHWTQPKPALPIARDTLGRGGWDSELPEGPHGQEGQGRPPRPHERSAKLELGPVAHA